VPDGYLDFDDIIRKLRKTEIWMSQAAATEVAKNFGEWHERAMREPVVITKHGRESAVLISAETFHKLLDGYREVVPVADLEASVADAIINSEIPEEYRWNSTDDDVPDARRGMGYG
jgi:prevent-host-death family protein